MTETQKQVIPRVQVALMMIHFMISSTQAVNVYSDSSIPIWMATGFSVIFSLPLILIIARISTLYPGKTLYEIFETLFGKPAGKALTAVYTVYAIYIASINIRYMGEYVNVVSMPQTPIFILLITIGIFCWWILRHGIEVFSRFSAIIFPVKTVVWIIILLMSMRLFDFSHIIPAFPEDIPKAALAGADLAAWSFSEIFLFLCLPYSMKSGKKGSYGVFLTSFAVSAVAIFIFTLSDMLIVGHYALSGLYFPHYAAMSLINIGDFITNIEVVGMLQYVLSASIKISVCVCAATCGLASLFGIEDAKMLTAPIVLTVLFISPVLFECTLEMLRFVPCYKFIALGLNVCIPVIVCIMAEIKHIIDNKKKKGVLQIA